MNDKVLIIDKALNDTVDNYYHIRNAKKLNNLYITLLTNVLDGNYNCISPKKRSSIKALGRDVILIELLKNIIKVNAYYASQKKYNIPKTSKNLDSENLTVENVEYLIYRELLRDNAELILEKFSSSPKVLLGSIISFVDSRYDKNTKIPNLDVVQSFNDLKFISELSKMQDKLIVE